MKGFQCPDYFNSGNGTSLFCLNCSKKKKKKKKNAKSQVNPSFYILPPDKQLRRCCLKQFFGQHSV